MTSRFWGAGASGLPAGFPGRGYGNPAFTLALDYDDSSYWLNGTRYGAISSVPGYTYTRTGIQGAVDASGVVAFFAANVPAINSAGYHAYGSATNYLLNAGGSGGLSTQNVTTTATPYTLSFIGTGTVTLSGTSTAGPLVGTGANDRVKLNFTPTAGTLTLTVTGSVTYAGLLDGTYGDGGPIIATAGATASIGISLMDEDDAPTDVAQLFWVTADIKQQQASNGASSPPRFVTWSDGTGNNLIAAYISGNITTTVDVTAAAVGVHSVTSGVGAVGKVAVVLLRSGGNWRSGVIRSGVLTWSAAAAAGAFPTGMNRVDPGQYGPAPNDERALKNPLIGVFRKTLTDTSDANILATVGSF